MSKSYSELTTEEKIASYKQIDDRKNKNANLLLKAAQYVANQALINLSESHFSQTDSVCKVAVPCLLELLRHIKNLCYYLPGWYPDSPKPAVLNHPKLDEIEGIMASLVAVASIELPRPRDEVTKPFEVVLKLTVD